MSETQPSAFKAPDQDRVVWGEAVSLLKQSGMTDSGARRFFGMLLAKNRLQARDVFPAVQAAKRCGTMDPRSYLTKAIHNRTAPDPSLLCDWS